MTALDALKFYQKQIGFLESELLIQHFLKISREKLHLDGEHIQLKADQSDLLKAAAQRILAKESLAYIVGYKDFYKSRFEVGPGVLVPRPESELVVEAVLKYKKEFKDIADFGAGSGCIGLSILAERPQAHLLCVEASSEAFRYLIKNANAFTNAKCVLTTVESVEGEFDVVVANPPYIATEDPFVDEGVRRYEPAQALFSEDHGFKHFTQWSLKAFEVLRPHGLFVCEIGYNQGKRAKHMMEKLFVDCDLIRDLNGHDRVILGFKTSSLA